MSALAAPAASVTWDGSASGYWSNGANWVGGVAPAPGDSLVFPVSAARYLTTNNFASGTAFGGIGVNGSNYVFRGNRIVLQDDLRALAQSGPVTFDLAITVDGPLLVTQFEARFASVPTFNGAIQLVDLGTPARTGALRNSAGATRVGGVEAAAVWRFGDSKLLVTYGHARGTRTDAVTGVREAMPLLTRQRFGADLMLEKPGVYRVGIEGIYYGRQALDDDPFLGQSKPYVYTMALLMRQFGPVEIVANFENLLDVRQTKFASLVRPTPAVGGRWTTDVWSPLEGFMANVAVRYRWPAGG